MSADGTVRGALGRLAELETAVEEGRVFVGRRRARSLDDPVAEGDDIVVHDPVAPVAGVHLLDGWNGLHAVWKPAGLPTEPDRRGGASLLRSVAPLLGVDPSALHAATRLDATVSGIVLVALGKDATRLVASLKEEGRIERRYLALAAGIPSPASGLWDTPIGRGDQGRPVAFGRDARAARTRYTLVADAGAHVSVLVLEPETGRSHQLRVHAAGAGVPLLGDVSRGAPKRLARSDGRVASLDRIALHAARVRVMTGDREEWAVTAAVAPELVALFQDLGGDPAAFDRALALPPLYAMSGS